MITVINMSDKTKNTSNSVDKSFSDVVKTKKVENTNVEVSITKSVDKSGIHIDTELMRKNDKNEDEQKAFQSMMGKIHDSMDKKIKEANTDNHSMIDIDLIVNKITNSIDKKLDEIVDQKFKTYLNQHFIKKSDTDIVLDSIPKIESSDDSDSKSDVIVEEKTDSETNVDEWKYNEDYHQTIQEEEEKKEPEFKEVKEIKNTPPIHNSKSDLCDFKHSALYFISYINTYNENGKDRIKNTHISKSFIYDDYCNIPNGFINGDKSSIIDETYFETFSKVESKKHKIFYETGYCLSNIKDIGALNYYFDSKVKATFIVITIQNWDFRFKLSDNEKINKTDTRIDVDFINKNIDNIFLCVNYFPLKPRDIVDAPNFGHGKVSFIDPIRIKRIFPNGILPYICSKTDKNKRMKQLLLYSIISMILKKSFVQPSIKKNEDFPVFRPDLFIMLKNISSYLRSLVKNVVKIDCKNFASSIKKEDFSLFFDDELFLSTEFEKDTIDNVRIVWTQEYYPIWINFLYKAYDKAHDIYHGLLC